MITKPKPRINFIDMARSYAIIYMIISHTVRVVLGNEHRTHELIFYKYWEMLSGTTAPIFLMISGTIFTYLLFKAQDGNNNQRAKKGIIRGASLIIIGYLLQFNPNVFSGASQYNYVIGVHILQCIGVGLILLVLLYKLHIKLGIKYYIIPSIIVIFLLLANRIVMQSEFISGLPIFFSNYFTNKNGSLFPIVPWHFYILLGGLLGNLLYRKPNILNKKRNISILIFIGLLINKGENYILSNIYSISKSEYIYDLLYSSTLIYNLSHALVIIGIIAFISLYVKETPKIIKFIAKNSLAIFVIHSFVVYNTYLTKGIAFYFSRSLDILPSILTGALAAVSSVLLMFLYIKLNNIIYNMNMRRTKPFWILKMIKENK